MACFSLGWAEQLCIWLVWVIVIVAVLRLLLPKLMSLFGGPPDGGVIFTINSYVLWGIVAVFCIIIAFDLIGCLVNSGTGPGLFPRRY